ncbi:MAG TPA: FAD-binding and (Fe-S)-binding domain-containing protein [Candidatus Acidoferrales bacterium]|nr:FAD-binding and (Fe-S)-binding domain-containing protein [Candidatus Acidoferrales bacterium]
MIDLITAMETIRTQTPSRRRRNAAPAPDIDRRGLEVMLAKAVRGEVRFDDGSRAMYSTDASNYRQIPIGVVIPRDADDVVATIAACREYGAPVVSRGGGTSLAGQACNVAVVMDFSKYMHRIIEIDWDRKRARVQPGCVLDDLRQRAEQRHLTFGPDPATHTHNTIGGMVGNNSCGMHAQMAGKVEENIEELEIVTYDGLRMRVGPTSDAELETIIAQGGRRGEIYAKMKALRDRYATDVRERFPNIPRRVSGYNLNELLPENGFNIARALVGSEGTLVTILEATCRLIWSPPARTLVVLGFEDVFAAGDHVPLVNAHGPIALEGLDDRLIGYMRKKHMHPDSIDQLPPGKGWLMVEFGAATREEADGKARALMADLRARPHAPSMKIIDDKGHEKKLWEVRESGLGATAHIPGEPETYPGWEDSACPPDRVGDYLRDLRALFTKYGYDPALYGHFGQGCIHCRVDFDLKTASGIEHWKAFLHEAAALVHRYGGSLSGEHGDGQARAELLPIMFGTRVVEAFAEFKAIWDPDDKMNPGKIVAPYHIDENLRYGIDYEPWTPKTHFAFPDDHGSFANAADRCVGVGNCRKENGGTMCPSYMATREEMHSTRGRARLLFEMMQGDPLKRGWREKAVADALDLCLACKGCKGECPVNVDMATYKAEFLSHYYAGRMRPIHSYAFGLMPWWAHLASRAPELANIVTQAPFVRDVAKLVAGVAPQRQLPPFARTPFRTWFERRGVKNHGGKPVLLWADTWNNYFHPETAQAAVEVLEFAGYNVLLAPAPLCCGRPLYDYGMLELAKTLLLQVLDAVRLQIRAGVPMVVLEPSCLSVFKDELHAMLPSDEDGKRLAQQSFMLSDFLMQHESEFEIPKLERKAVVHGHCHHKAVLGFDSEQKLLEKMGLDVEVLDSGCCGMAGAFGFERSHYDVSVSCAERALTPAVCAASDTALIVNDGFSCREQIMQLTPRRALHVAQVLKMAYDQPPREPFPERRYTSDPHEARRRATRNAAILAGVAGAVGVAVTTWSARYHE